MTFFKGKEKLLFFVILVIAALMIPLIFNATGAPAKTYAADTGSETKRTLNVSGQGVIYAAPDIAYVTLGVVSEAKDASTAQKANAEAMAKVVAQIKAAGIKEIDIKTVNYSIFPKYDYDKMTGESNIIGYTVNNSVQVTVRDITKTGSIIDIAAGNGMNTASSISFGLSDYDSYYLDALKTAIDTAKKKADTMAEALGITLKLPLTVSESGYNPPMIYYGLAEYKSDMASTPIQGGSLEVRAFVNISYEY